MSIETAEIKNDQESFDLDIRKIKEIFSRLIQKADEELEERSSRNIPTQDREPAREVFGGDISHIEQTGVLVISELRNKVEAELAKVERGDLANVDFSCAERALRWLERRGDEEGTKDLEELQQIRENIASYNN